MSRLLSLFITALVISGCWIPRRQVVVVAPPPPVIVNGRPPAFRYWGQHPIPGGGWCFIEGQHLHPYSISGGTNYVVTNNVYYYRGPVACSFGGPHPIVGGGWCYLGYPHSHNYCPTAEYRAAYTWEPRSRAFVYHSPPPSYHGNAPAYHPAAPVRP